MTLPFQIMDHFCARWPSGRASQASCVFSQQSRFLQIVDHCLSKERVLFTVHRISPLDQARQPYSIQVAVTCAHTEDDLQKAAKALEGAVQQVGSWRWAV